MSHSTTAARKSGDSASSARCTSSSKWGRVGSSGPPHGWEASGGLVGQGVETDALLASHLVEEDVGRDAVQPALEGAGLVAVQRPEDADEHVVGEVLGVVRVAVRR